MTVFMQKLGLMELIYQSQHFKMAVLAKDLNILAYIAESYNYQ